MCRVDLIRDGTRGIIMITETRSMAFGIVSWHPDLLCCCAFDVDGRSIDIRWKFLHRHELKINTHVVRGGMLKISILHPTYIVHG